MSGDRCPGRSTSHWRKTLVHPLSVLPGHHEVNSFALLHAPRHDMLSLHRPEAVRSMAWTEIFDCEIKHTFPLYTLLIIYHSTES